jgi:hypothetical protein
MGSVNRGSYLLATWAFPAVFHSTLQLTWIFPTVVHSTSDIAWQLTWQLGWDGWHGDTCHDHGMIQYSRIAFMVSGIVCLRKRSVTCFGSAFWTFIITCLDADKRMCHIFECVLENAFRRKLTFAVSTLCNIKVDFVCSLRRNVMFIQTHSSWPLWHIQTLLNVSNNVM